MVSDGKGTTVSVIVSCYCKLPITVLISAAWNRVGWRKIDVFRLPFADDVSNTNRFMSAKCIETKMINHKCSNLIAVKFSRGRRRMSLSAGATVLACAVFAFLLTFHALATGAGRSQTTSGKTESVVDINDVTGNNIGEKLQSCVVLLSASGGICDARRFQGSRSIKSLQIDRSVKILFGAGAYTVYGSIRVRGAKAVALEGTGAADLGAADENKSQGTSFIWAGNDHDSMFWLASTSQSRFAGFTIVANRSAPLATGFYSENAGLGPTAGRNVFDDIFIEGTNGAVRDGFRYGIGAGGDNNNAEDTFIHVRVANYSHAGWSFEAAQSKANRFYSCSFHGNRYGEFGISTYGGPTTRGGSFLWYGGMGAGNTGADFYLGAPDDAILISGGNFEGSTRFLDTAPGNSSNAYPVTIEGVRYSGDRLAADGHAIRFTHPGPLVLIGNIFGEVKQSRLDVLYQGYVGSYGEAIAIGNAFGSTLADPLPGANWTSLGNLVAADGVKITGIVPDRIRTNPR
jgi:hypothetical protein